MGGFDSACRNEVLVRHLKEFVRRYMGVVERLFVCLYLLFVVVALSVIEFDNEPNEAEFNTMNSQSASWLPWAS